MPWSCSGFCGQVTFRFFLCVCLLTALLETEDIMEWNTEGCGEPLLPEEPAAGSPGQWASVSRRASCGIPCFQPSQLWGPPAGRPLLPEEPAAGSPGWPASTSRGAGCGVPWLAGLCSASRRASCRIPLAGGPLLPAEPTAGSPASSRAGCGVPWPCGR